MSGDDGGVQSGVPADVIEKYETLRRAVLCEGLSLESRNGLALFLRRGMWGWVQTAATPIAPPRLERAALAGSSVEDEHQAVVHLFAAMATRSSKRRADERIA